MKDMQKEWLEGIMKDLIYSFRTIEKTAYDAIDVMNRTLDAIIAAYEIKCEMIREKMKEATDG